MSWAEFTTRQFLKYRNSCDSQYYEPYNLRNDRGKLRFKLTCDVVRAMLLTKPELIESISPHYDQDTFSIYPGERPYRDDTWASRCDSIAEIMGREFGRYDRPVVNYTTGPITKYLVMGDFTLMKKSMKIMTDDAIKSLVDAEVAKRADIKSVFQEFVKGVDGARIVNIVRGSSSVEEMSNSLGQMVSNAIQQAMTQAGHTYEGERIGEDLMASVNDTNRADRNSDPIERLRELLQAHTPSN